MTGGRLRRPRGWDDYVRERTARRAYRCDHRIGCPGALIAPGERYTETVTYPGSDANPDGPRPWRARSCQRCITPEMLTQLLSGASS